MDFIWQFAGLALLIVAIMAFMGIVSTKLASLFGGKKATEAFDQMENSKKGWKQVGGNKR